MSKRKTKEPKEPKEVKELQNNKELQDINQLTSLQLDDAKEAKVHWSPDTEPIVLTLDQGMELIAVDESEQHAAASAASSAASSSASSQLDLLPRSDMDMAIKVVLTMLEKIQKGGGFHMSESYELWRAMQVLHNGIDRAYKHV